MYTQPRNTLIALTLGTAISAAWLSAVVIGMQSSAPASIPTFELPRVVVVARKAAAAPTTPLPQATPAKIS